MEKWIDTDRYINWYLFLFFVYLYLHVPKTINKTSNLNLYYVVSFDQWKKSYRNAKFEKKVQHFYVICNASPPGTVCIIQLCRVSPFNRFMSLAFFGAKDIKRGYSLLKNSL